MKRVLIIYQHRVREYDNALLLKVALERQGYKVDIKHDASEANFFRRYDLYLFPCLYNNFQMDFLTYRFNTFNMPIINMRYEQVCTRFDLAQGAMVPREQAVTVPALCWGKLDYENCVRFGMPEDLLTINGSITLDFLREEFRDFWYSREEIAAI